MSDIDILRRIAERGLRLAQQDTGHKFIGIFQHMLDEIYRVEKHQKGKVAWEPHDPPRPPTHNPVA